MFHSNVDTLKDPCGTGSLCYNSDMHTPEDPCDTGLSDSHGGVDTLTCSMRYWVGHVSCKI